MTIWRMRIACWTPDATNPHTQYVTLFAFQQQQWSHESTSMLRYVNIACLDMRIAAKSLTIDV
jgi:hypothetical protein